MPAWCSWLDQNSGGGPGFGGRLQDDGVAGGQRGQDAAGGDGVGEVPRRRHHDDTARFALHFAVHVGQQPLERPGPAAYQRA